MEDKILEIIKEESENANVRKYTCVNEFGYSQFERNIADRVVKLFCQPVVKSSNAFERLPLHMNKVHIILELKSEDYHGTYKEIIAVYSNEEDCKAKIKELEEENYNYNIEYWHEVFNVL